MKITKIEKKKRLYLLELDGNEKLYITEDTIVHFMLSKNKEVNQQELEEIKSYAQFSYGKNLALHYLSFKQRSKKEVRDYLIKHEIDKIIIPQVLTSLEKENWLNDRKYTETLLQQNLRTGDKGPYVLQQKLKEKGIDPQVISEELAKLDFSELLEKLSQKLLRQYQTKLPQKALRDKIIQRLTNKGFDYQTAKETYQQLDIISEEENEQELIYKELDKLYPKYSRKYQDYELKQRLIQALSRKGFGFDDIKSALREYL